MANFPNGLELTPAGEALNAKLLAHGIPFGVDAIVIGDGEWYGPGFPNALVNQVYAAESVKKYIVTAHIAVFEVDLTPLQELLTESLHVREIGLIAVDPDDGPILYCYGNCGDDYNTVPPSPGGSFVRQIVRIPVRIANTANIIVNIEQNNTINIIGSDGIIVAAAGDQIAISLNVGVEYITDTCIASDGQDVFLLTNTSAHGALTVYIEGVAAQPGEEWTIDGGAVTLAYPLPEGRKVWIQEARIVKGGGI